MGKAGPEEWKEILAETGNLKPVPSVPRDVPSLADALDLEMFGEELAGFGVRQLETGIPRGLETSLPMNPEHLVYLERCPFHCGGP